MTSRNFAERSARLLFETKAEDIQVLDLRKLGGPADFFVIASGASSPHVRALADHVEQEWKRAGERAWHAEGYEAERWVLLDYIHVVIHISQPRTREFSLLDRLWGHAREHQIAYVLPARGRT